jgi:hypothetical protein
MRYGERKDQTNNANEAVSITRARAGASLKQRTQMKFLGRDLGAEGKQEKGRAFD